VLCLLLCPHTILPVCTEASLLVAETAGSVKLLTSFGSGMNTFCSFMNQGLLYFLPIKILM